LVKKLKRKAKMLNSNPQIYKHCGEEKKTSFACPDADALLVTSWMKKGHPNRIC